MAKRKLKFNKKILLPIVLIVVAVAIGLLWFFSQSAPSAKVYFLKEGNMLAVSRPLNPDEDVVSRTAFELLAGPNEEETAKGCFSEIPKDAKISAIKKRGDILEIEFNPALANYGGGSARVTALVAQIVYTFTEIPGIKKVRILIKGRKELVLGGEGLVIDRPLGREDFSR